MSWYKNQNDKWIEIINHIYNSTNRDCIMIEKDIIQSMFLYEISKSDLPFVFKGGNFSF